MLEPRLHPCAEAHREAGCRGQRQTLAVSRRRLPRPIATLAEDYLNDPGQGGRRTVGHGR